MAETASDLERTIQAMENNNVCLHPKHCHSFQPIQFLLPGKSCAGCNQRLNPVVFGTLSDESKQVVRCLGCGALAHRRCALSRDLVWNETCPVNSARIESEANSSSLMVIVEEDDDNSDRVNFEETNVNDPNVSKGRPSAQDSDRINFEETNVCDPNVSKGLPSTQDSSACTEVSHDGLLTLFTPGDSTEDNDEEVHVTPLHYASHPFASVSRALQENIRISFGRKGTPSDGDCQGNDVQEFEDPSVPESQEASLDGEIPENETVAKPGQGTNETEDTIENSSTKIGLATVAGGIAGGVAGLAIAGPVGAMTGLGVILEGSVSIGVFVASVAGGYSAGKRQQDRTDEKRRVLSMGEPGTTRKVLLVRPNINIDPVWEKNYDLARSTSPKDPIALELLLHTKDKDVVANRDRRYRHFSDILKPGDDEISSNDKVFLMVNRILNDKDSLPGHVYRYLIQVFKNRCEERENILAKNASVTGLPPRSRRDDAHAVIKLVTATLLEVWPALGASPERTELTATAVENLVFVKIYDLVFEEIIDETKILDNAMKNKVEEFAELRPMVRGTKDYLISDEALEALCMLPQSQSVEDKLHFCVIFLERISDHFARSVVGKKESICADSLLKLTCQHILSCSMGRINAEVAFLEEFARDEQLLRGREGYALVTLQASLHFINKSTDFEKDIFTQDDDERNVPVDSS